MLLKIKGLPHDRDGGENLEGLSESKQKEKEVKLAVFYFYCCAVSNSDKCNNVIYYLAGPASRPHIVIG